MDGVGRNRRVGRLDPATACVRQAIDQALLPSDWEADGGPLVALSGGPDSLALAAGVSFVARGRRWAAGVVDHGLQPGSDIVAERAAQQARALGAWRVEVVRVFVGSDGGAEAAARTARYEALERIRSSVSCSVILVAHTMDDQAETVLLGLARGSGLASISGMRERTDRIVRPLLGVRREQTAAVCEAAGLAPWRDPQNADPAFARVRVRQRVLPVLEWELGPGVAEALARTAGLAARDSDALGHWADAWAADHREQIDAGAVSAVELAALPVAVRGRVIRRVAREAFGTALTFSQCEAIDALVVRWHGQGRVAVPRGGVEREAGGLLRFRRFQQGVAR